jgi:hypothetical protein
MPQLIRLVNTTLFLMLLGVIAVADDEPPVEPPGPDETLIYVMREGRMLGAAGGHWIAINDKTVGSLRNDTHAVFRYPAGLITLNIASGGAPAASIALDNRGGETVYLEYKLGATEFVELDEKAAQKLIRKTDLKEPLLEVEPNNEQFAVLMNLSRLGFDVMEPAEGPAEPDAEHGVVTIFRQKDGDKFDFGIWNEGGFVGTLGAREAITLRLEPGSYLFMAGNLGYTQMLADVEAGKRYYAWLDYGGWVGRVRLTPVPATDARELEKLLGKVSYVTLGPAMESENIRARERMVVDYVLEVAEMARAGTVDFNLLGAEHAFP